MTTAYIRNGVRRTALLDIQSQRFFDFSRSPVAARRRTYVFGRQVFSLFPKKALLTSIKTRVGTSRDPAREKAVTVLPRKIFPTDACTYVTWMSTDVALLVSTSRFGKSVQMRLNFDPSGSSKHMAS